MDTFMKLDTELCKNIHEIIVPDGVEFNADVTDFPNLEKISMSVKDYVPIEKFSKGNRGKVELRMPLTGNMMKTETIQRLFDKITGLYAKVGRLNSDDHSLFYVYDLASRAWYEDLTLLCLIEPGLEDGLFSFDMVKDSVPTDVINAAEVLTAKYDNVYDLAEKILSNQLLHDYYNLRVTVNREYEYDYNDELGSAIDDIVDYTVDLGQHFTVDVSVEGSVLHGFDGTGRLNGCRYIISGNSTYEMNQEIIRMTSGDIKAPDDYNDFVNKTNFNFFKQRWYAQDGKMGGLWSYPDGTIHDEGVVDNDETVTWILLEMCLLAQKFPGLYMNVAFWVPDTKYINSNRRSRQIVS